MANEHRQGCSTLLIVREMQVKTTTSTQVRMAIIKHLQTTNAGEGVEKGESSCTIGGSANWYSHYVELYGDSLKKTRNKTSIWPNNPITGHTPWEYHNWKTCMHPNVDHSTIYNS